MKFDLFGRLTGPRTEVEHKLIVFQIAEIRCGLGIMTVREIMNPGQIVPIPTAPPAASPPPSILLAASTGLFS